MNTYIKILSLVIVTISLSIPAISFGQNLQEDLYIKTDNFLKENVVSGKVKYSEIAENMDELKELMTVVENYSFENSSSVDEKKAFWINAYNLLVINSIVEYYPIKSPQDINGFFKSIEHKAAGEMLTFDQIEHEKLINPTGDPRIHFAIVCGAAGCPEIISEAYTPDKIEIQLEKRALDVINDEDYVSYDKSSNTLHLSQIFNWYKGDFEKEASSVIEYLNEYAFDTIPSDAAIDYMQYDWTLNDAVEGEVEVSLQSYTPAVLLHKGQTELKIFNNLYTQTAYFNDSGERTDLNARNTFLTSLVSFFYGISDGINIGLEFWFRSVRNDKSDSSPFDVLNFQSDEMSRTAISRLGPKIKFAPFKSEILRNLSIQSTLLFPVASELSGNGSDLPYIDDDAHIWLNQFFYDVPLSDKFSYFGEIDTWFRVDREFNGKANSLQLPFKSFLSYYPNQQFTFYAMVEYLNEWAGNATAYYTQAGLGAKYLLLPNLELEGLYTNFFLGNNKGAGETFNIGFRLVN